MFGSIGMWEDFSDRVAYWADMENPYITYDNNYIESVWWALKQIFDKGLLYKGSHNTLLSKMWYSFLVTRLHKAIRMLKKIHDS